MSRHRHVSKAWQGIDGTIFVGLHISLTCLSLYVSFMVYGPKPRMSVTVKAWRRWCKCWN
jgi:hypothetical protein